MQAYAQSQPTRETIAAIRSLLQEKAGHPEAERIRTLLNHIRGAGLLSQEAAADAETRLRAIQVTGMTQEQAVASVQRRFETVPNGFGGTTTRKVEPARTAKAAPKPAQAKPRTPKSAIARWVAEGFLDTVSTDTERCGRCAGTGQFITGSVNGKPTGPGGPCFRCSGKGRQTDCGPEAHRAIAAAVEAGTRDTTACCDRLRNDLYDTYGIRIHL